MHLGPWVIRDRYEFAEWIEHAKEPRSMLPTCHGLPTSLEEALNYIAGLSSVGQPTDKAEAEAWAAYAKEYPSRPIPGS